MIRVTDYPLAVFALSFAVLSLAAWLGKAFPKGPRVLDAEAREGFRVIEAATLTLLGLIIGFSFSMAVNRYDQRKNYEEAEANAIGTEYVRAELLPAADAAKVKALLRDYIDQRVVFYTVRRGPQLEQCNAQTVQLQAALWSAVKGAAGTQPTPIVALVVAGMNDVLNSQGYTQAAWWNRIPTAAWGLMGTIAMAASALVGFGARSEKVVRKWLLILPLVVSIALLLIADIDSPRGGLIRVAPQNIISLSGSLHAL